MVKKTIYICPVCDTEVEALEDDKIITFECKDCKLTGTVIK